MLLCAVASCYTTTFHAIAESSKFPYTDLQVEVEGYIGKAESGYSFNGITIRANLVIHQPEEHPRALKLLHKAEALCLVSRALSVKKTFTPNVQVGGVQGEISPAMAPDKEERLH